MARMQAEVDGQRSARSSVSLGYVLDEWLRAVELEDSTRETYVGYVERTIRPALGAVSIAKLTTRTVAQLLDPPGAGAGLRGRKRAQRRGPHPEATDALGDAARFCEAHVVGPGQW